MKQNLKQNNETKQKFGAVLAPLLHNLREFSSSFLKLLVKLPEVIGESFFWFYRKIENFFGIISVEINYNGNRVIAI